MYPPYNDAATEAACMGYAVLFSYLHKRETLVGLVWWDGDKRFHRGLTWDKIQNQFVKSEVTHGRSV